jgi:hypothetical protein
MVVYANERWLRLLIVIVLCPNNKSFIIISVIPRRNSVFGTWILPRKISVIPMDKICEQFGSIVATQEFSVSSKFLISTNKIKQYPHTATLLYFAQMHVQFT